MPISSAAVTRATRPPVRLTASKNLYDAVERVLVYDTETIEIVWKFNELKIDTDENMGVAN